MDSPGPDGDGRGRRPATVSIAGAASEALTVGVPDADGNPVLVVPAGEVPDGGHLY